MWEKFKGYLHTGWAWLNDMYVKVFQDKDPKLMGWLVFAGVVFVFLLGAIIF